MKARGGCEHLSYVFAAVSLWCLWMWVKAIPGSRNTQLHKTMVTLQWRSMQCVLHTPNTSHANFLLHQTIPIPKRHGSPFGPVCTNSLVLGPGGHANLLFCS